MIIGNRRFEFPSNMTAAEKNRCQDQLRSNLVTFVPLSSVPAAATGLSIGDYARRAPESDMARVLDEAWNAGLFGDRVVDSRWKDRIREEVKLPRSEPPKANDCPAATDALWSWAPIGGW